MDDLEARFKGYDMSQIDDVAAELFQFLVEMDISVPLSILGLCRAITIVGEKSDLDAACRVIDEFSEIPFLAVELDIDEEDDSEF